jgi:hypothetical protein
MNQKTISSDNKHLWFHYDYILSKGVVNIDIDKDQNKHPEWFGKHYPVTTKDFESYYYANRKKVDFVNKWFGWLF